MEPGNGEPRIPIRPETGIGVHELIPLRGRGGSASTDELGRVSLRGPRSIYMLPKKKKMFQVTEIVRFLLERGLRFRDLGFCGHILM